MTDDHEQKASATAPATDGANDQQDYKVGYGKPPLATQFRKGQSGNPAGSSKARKQALKRARYMSDPLSSLVLAEAERKVTVRENGKQFEMSAAEVTVRAMCVAASKGSVLAGRTVLEWVRRAEAAKRAALEEEASTMMKVQADGHAALKQAAAAGLPPPMLLPHPDDLHIDPNTLEVQILGPVDEVTYEAFQYVVKGRDAAKKELDALFGKRRLSATQRTKAAKLRTEIATFERNLPPSMRLVKPTVMEALGIVVPPDKQAL